MAESYAITVDGVPVGTLTVGLSEDVPTFAPGEHSSAHSDAGFAPGITYSHHRAAHYASLEQGAPRAHDGRPVAPQKFTTGDIKDAVRSGRGHVHGWWTPERQRHAIDYLQERADLPEVSARALVARFAGVEASGGPSEVNAIGATGIAQWLGARKRGVVRGDFEGQLGHVVEELKGSEGRAYHQLRNATTEVQAAVGASMYERAEGYNPRTGADYFVGKTIATMRRLAPTTPKQPQITVGMPVIEEPKPASPL